MARPKAQVPALQFHLSGQAIVQIAGTTYYLGKHGSPESLARYAVLIREYQSNGLKVPEEITSQTLQAMTAGFSVPIAATHQADEPIRIKHVTEAYREHVKIRYANSHAEEYRVGKTCDEMNEHDGDMLADDYGPKALQRQRDRWVKSGKARSYCNRLTNSVVRMFKWAVSEELVNESTWSRLKSVSALREGQTVAPETDAIKPVPIEHVRATVKELSPIVKAMVRVQIATGMRPSELCSMRPVDIDRSGEVWVYRPPHHKNKSKGKTRAIPILGDAMDAVVDYMNRPAESYLFSPAEADAWFRAKQRSERKGYGSYKKKAVNPKNKPGARYTAMTYRRAIDRAAKRAKVPTWHPYQLRHLNLTQIRDTLGPEYAQAMGGHSKIDMTMHYAKATERQAIEAAKHAPTLGNQSSDSL
jgi:integrase